jgi:GNAT superfamily N-acetyltransferase
MSGPPAPQISAGRAAAVAFMRAVEDACAERLVPIAGGCAVVDARHPRLWDANHLRVEASEAPDADALAAAAERHQAQLPFRAINALDAAVGAALAEPLHAQGYCERHDLLMLLDPLAPPPPADPSIEIAEVSSALIVASHLAAAREHEFEPEVGRQLASRDELIAAATPVRWFAALADRGEVAARCKLLGEGTTLQVESVYTSPAHRGRGLARALIVYALREAHAAGAERIFLRTDASDWPQRLYRRLGFVDAGLLPRFHRIP